MRTRGTSPQAMAFGCCSQPFDVASQRGHLGGRLAMRRITARPSRSPACSPPPPPPPSPPPPLWTVVVEKLGRPRRAAMTDASISVG